MITAARQDQQARQLPPRQRPAARKLLTTLLPLLPSPIMLLPLLFEPYTLLPLLFAPCIGEAR